MALTRASLGRHSRNELNVIERHGLGARRRRIYAGGVDPIAAALALVALVAVATVLGLWWQRRDGTVRAFDGPAVQLADTELEAWPERATLLQFSTEFCSRCPGTRRFLRQLAGEHDGVLHSEIDLTQRADLADRYEITQTPTVFILDGYGRIRARVAGAPKAEPFRHTLTDVLRSPRDDYAI